MADLLEQHGWSVWWDRTILPGQSFDQVIQEALNSAKCVIVLWSRHSIVSDWVKDEAADAAARHILVPALIEDVSIPLGFRRLQTANLSDWQGKSAHPGLAQILQAVSAKLGCPLATTNIKPPNKVRKKTTVNAKTQSGAQWRAELLSKNLSMRKLKVHLTQATHIIEIHATMWKDYVVVDGERMSESLGFDNNHLFEVSDGNVRYAAKVVLNAGVASIKGFRLLVSGQILYRENDLAD
jgi:hypothetical protein